MQYFCTLLISLIDHEESPDQNQVLPWAAFLTLSTLSSFLIPHYILAVQNLQRFEVTTCQPYSCPSQSKYHVLYAIHLQLLLITCGSYSATHQSWLHRTMCRAAHVICMMCHSSKAQWLKQLQRTKATNTYVVDLPSVTPVSTYIFSTFILSHSAATAKQWEKYEGLYCTCCLSNWSEGVRLICSLGLLTADSWTLHRCPRFQCAFNNVWQLVFCPYLVLFLIHPVELQLKQMVLWVFLFYFHYYNITCDFLIYVNLLEFSSFSTPFRLFSIFFQLMTAEPEIMSIWFVRAEARSSKPQPACNALIPSSSSKVSFRTNLYIIVVVLDFQQTLYLTPTDLSTYTTLPFTWLEKTFTILKNTVGPL